MTLFTYQPHELAPTRRSGFSFPDSRLPIPDWLVVVVLTCACMLFTACSQAVDPIEIADAWAPATPPNATVGAVYMRITAHESDVLVRASTTAAQSVEMHRSSVEDGVAKMRRIDSLPFQQHETVALEPGGTHFMLIGLSSPLSDGQQLPFELEFKNAGKVAVNVPVMARGDDHAHH